MDSKIFDEITVNNMPTSVHNKISELKRYQHHLMGKYQIPNKKDNWKAFFDKVNELEKDPNTFNVAQEFWNIDWILSELENIESSIGQISECLNEKKKFTYEKYIILNKERKDGVSFIRNI